MSPRAVIFGCAGTELAAPEARFFAAADPLGFILFARNVANRDQLRKLVADLRQSVGRPDAPVLVDQEGGRVQRLKPPQWRAAPAPARFGELARGDLPAAVEAVRLNARLIGAELAELGIDMVCAPSLDLRHPGMHDVIGDRAFSDDPEIVVALGRAAMGGFCDAGVMPIIKHMPGHGRSSVDSHLSLPVVDASRAELEGGDFRPFKALADAPWGMTAHLLFRAIDPERPATISPKVIAEIIRGHIGFAGMLVSDDLSMQALPGSIAERAAATLAAGCDLALHCNGRMTEMEAVAAVVPLLAPVSLERLARAGRPARAAAPIDHPAAAREVDRLLAGAAHA
jgi:beta-N-acetylhexosaminidase